MSRRGIGVEAEDRAAKLLLERGYVLLTRRYKSRFGEVDLVALDGETLVLVEVRMRSGGETPERSVTPRKIARFHSAADQYIAESGVGDRPVRYDFVAITSTGAHLIQDAFRGPAWFSDAPSEYE